MTTENNINELLGRLDKSSPIPLYIQVKKEIIKGKIEHGDWKPGFLIPGEINLADIFDVSQAVTRQALKEFVS